MTSLRRQLALYVQRHYLDLELPGVVETPLAWLEHALFDHSAQQVAIDRPIFIVGCHRSGTTVLYETLAQHPDLVYFTNASSILPRVPLLSHRLIGLLGRQEGEERFVQDGLQVSYATPSEGTRIWEYHAPAEEHSHLDETYADPQLEHYLKLTIQKHLKHLGGKRFINKSPDNSVRIRYLNKLFPDAYFIHIIRDGRAVCNSLIKFREAAAQFFGSDHRHAVSGVRVQNWRDIESHWQTDPVVSIGMLWVEIIKTIERDKQVIDPDRYLELRYEDFVAQPLEHLQTITEFCNLPWTQVTENIYREATQTLDLGSRNEAWKERLSREQVEKLISVVGPKMREYQYEV